MTTRLCKAVTLGLLTGILGLTASLLPYGYDLEESIGLGLLFKLRGQRQAPSDVVVIAVDKASADQLKLPLDPKKWRRSYHARMIQKLANEGASVIVFDLMFDEVRSAADDRVFANAIREARNVVLLGYLEREVIPLNHRSGRVTGEMAVDRMRPPTSVLSSLVRGLLMLLSANLAQAREFWGSSFTASSTASMVFLINLIDKRAKKRPIMRALWDGKGRFCGVWGLCPPQKEITIIYIPQSSRGSL